MNDVKILPSDVSVVIQGPCSDTLPNLVESIPKECEIIVSTWSSEIDSSDVIERLQSSDFPIAFVFSEDPGPLPPTTRSIWAKENNINRMIVSSRAGLEVATRPFCLRLRSDAASINVEAVLDFYNQFCSSMSNPCIIVPSLYTRHPYGFNGYLYHMSDWMTFGRTDVSRRLWRSVPLMSIREASAFGECGPLTRRPNLRRWRAVLAQEQWIAVHWFRTLGYEGIDWIGQSDRHLRREWRTILCRHVIVVDPQAINLVIPAHRHAYDSPYQRIDCCWHADWLALRRQKERHEPGWRWPFFLLRDLVVGAILLRKSLIRQWRRLREGVNAEHRHSHGWARPSLCGRRVQDTEAVDRCERCSDDQTSHR